MPSHNMIKEERKIKPEKTGNKGSDKKDSVSIKTVSKESSF
jgi:hypothetical protein